MINCADQRIRNGSSNSLLAIRCECITEVDLGANRATKATMVIDSAMHGQLVEIHADGSIVGRRCGY